MYSKQDLKQLQEKGIQQAQTDEQLNFFYYRVSFPAHCCSCISG